MPQFIDLTRSQEKYIRPKYILRNNIWETLDVILDGENWMLRTDWLNYQTIITKTHIDMLVCIDKDGLYTILKGDFNI